MAPRRSGVRTAVAFAIGGALSVGAWALEPSDRASGSVARHRTRVAAPTTASNQRAAVRDSSQLLQGVVVPADAVVLSSGAAIGAHARLLTAALSSAVAYRIWTVPGDPATVLSFVQAHLPPGSTISGSGSGGRPFTQSVTRSWPAVHGVLDSRLLEIEVTERAGGGTRLYVEAQSQWVVTRPKAEHIPAGVREVDITDGWPGHTPFLSRRVTGAASVQRLVVLFNSLGIAQPVGVSCPSESVVPVVTVSFRAGGTGEAVAQATVDSSANLPWPASAPGWNCFSIAFTLHGRNWNRLVGNVIAPIQRMLHVKLTRTVSARFLRRPPRRPVRDGGPVPPPAPAW